MKYLLSIIAVFACTNVYAAAWQLASGQPQLPIWPGVIPDAKSAAGPEDEVTLREDRLIAGRPWLELDNVTRPTMIIYSPKGRNTGAAIIVFPGGGYSGLAIDLEGTEVCDWLTSTGTTCVLLKYRVPGSGPHWDKIHNVRVIPKTHSHDGNDTQEIIMQHIWKDQQFTNLSFSTWNGKIAVRYSQNANLNK